MKIATPKVNNIQKNYLSFVQPATIDTCRDDADCIAIFYGHRKK